MGHSSLEGWDGLGDNGTAPTDADPATLTAAPAHWTCDVVLVDGGTAHVRPIERVDSERLVEFHAGLSQRTQYLRFFSAKPILHEALAERLATVDHRDRVALVAEVGGRLIGVARYDRIKEGRPDSGGVAEVAFVIADEHQGRGLGTVMLEHLASAAREHGITRFVAETLAENRRMLDVFRSAGFEERMRMENGVVHVEMLIEPTEQSRAVVEAREHRAEAASIARVLAPRSVAVIGASRTPRTVGNQVLRNLLTGGFDGTVYPVNPSADHVSSVKAYASVLDIPDAVDMAVLAVPATAVLPVVEECARKGVSGLVVLSAGFSEVGEQGAAAQQQLRDIARQSGMRVVGPNCIGLVNTAVGLDATFSPYSPRAGRIAMQSQSGAIGIAILERSARIGLGVSSFVSVGNKADVSGNDLLQYWEDDPSTAVVLLYLESFGNPRKFSRIARRVSRRKPIVAVKSGRSAAGVRAASSHTAAMASPDVAVDALFGQTGVIRVDTVDEMFDMALLLGSQPLPDGRRVAIVGNSGGPGILATDACDSAGLQIPELGAGTQSALRQVVDPNASVANPVDLVAAATPGGYEQALRLVLADDAVDAAIVICTPTFAAPPHEVADVLCRVVAETSKPLVGCFLAWTDLPPLLGERGIHTVPAFASPEPAVRALGRAATYAEWRRRPPGSVPPLLRFDVDRARSLVSDALDGDPDGGWLNPTQTSSLLATTGIGQLASRTVTSAQEAAEAAAAIGLPVVLKASGPTIVHKSDLGGIELGLDSTEAVADAYRAMALRVGAPMTGALVQEMTESGVETIVGVVQDPLFGPLVMFGLGGTATELLGDRAFRVLPVTDHDAAELVRSLQTSPLLFGYRGAPSVAVDDLEDLLQRVARLAGQIPELAELDLNPVICTPRGVVAVDARARLQPIRHQPAPDLRRM